MKCYECKRDVVPAQVGYYRLHEGDCLCATCLAVERSKFQSGAPEQGKSSTVAKPSELK